MNRYIRRESEVFLIKKGVLLMTEEDKASTWGRLRESNYFIVYEGDMLFYQREDGSQEYGIAKYFSKDSGLTWGAASPQEIAIAKAYLLLVEP